MREDAIELYATAHSGLEPPLLAELSRETAQKAPRPRMLSGHYQGRFLSLLSNMMRPRRILEIGTYTGYSAICLAEGLAPDGLIITIDKFEELKTISQKYFERSGYQDKIKPMIGHALEVIPTLEEQFDMVFIDADKENYAAYFKLVIDKMRPGGIILSDNVLWGGRVLEPTQDGDVETASLKEYNELLAQDERVETVMLTVRDGLTVSRVK